MDPYGFNINRSLLSPNPEPVALGHPPPLSAAINYNRIPIYSDMIKDAIRALNQPNGSTWHAIVGHINRAHHNYHFIPSAELIATIEALKGTGEIVQIDHLFKLPGGTMQAPPDSAADPPLAVRRKPGRPPKNKPNSKPTVHQQADDVDEPVGERVKRAGRQRRRRRRFVTSEEDEEEEDSNNDGVAVESSDRVTRGMAKRLEKTTPELLSGLKSNPKAMRSACCKHTKCVSDSPDKAEAVAAAGSKMNEGPGMSQGGEQAVVAAAPKKNDGLLKKAGSRKRLGQPAMPLWTVDYAHVRERIDQVQSNMRDAILVVKEHMIEEMKASRPLSIALEQLDRISTMDIMTASLDASDEEAAEEIADA